MIPTLPKDTCHSSPGEDPMRTDHAIKPILGIAAALAFSLLAGCGASDDPGPASPRPESREQANEAASPPAAREQASLPDGFPEQFPLPPDFEVTEARFTPSDTWNQGGFLVRGNSATDVAGLEAFFKRGLADAGFEVPNNRVSGMTRGGAMVMFRGHGFKDASIQIDPDTAGANLIISLPLDD
jgi:hypothetical protein